METISSVRSYTNQQVNPLLAARLETEAKFIPESVPSYSAREVFEILKHQNPEYQDMFYKDATLNPTNPRDKADDFETKVVNRFRQETDLKKIQGFRTLAEQKIFYIAIPVKITDSKCLRCHSTVAQAPKSLLASYGDKNGFGWNLNDIIGTQILYFPTKQVNDISNHYLSLAIEFFISIFVITLIIVNILLKQIVNSLQPMMKLAQTISADGLNLQDSPQVDLKSLDPITARTDELGQLGRVFRTMLNEVYSREQRLRLQLKQLLSQFDQSRNASQLDKNLDVNYLKSLQEEAKNLRNKRDSNKPDKE